MRQAGREGGREGQDETGREGETRHAGMGRQDGRQGWER